ncbi:teosinte glume architecture 1-like [Durio zibethinus]|uniref:Teosinte glume architecture 1-like n=1 Tax=Durio zibethinus TaxID=66656 RepID=A0A6P6BEH6_DURZI|nr:teosinte glume architecture 1-like [Durio zibethinus]
MDLDYEESALRLSQLEDKGFSCCTLITCACAVGRAKNFRVKSPNKRSLKRSSVANQNQKMSRLVDDCKSDLGKDREYYRHHRVCEHHSKDPVVIVEGEEKRFPALGEFDEEKRSCRKRLEGHNRRRRKSRPKSLHESPGRFLINFG